MKSLQGCFLVASPRLLDPNFFQSVVFIVRHDDEGAMGLIINRPSQTSLAEAWKQVEESHCRCDAPIFQGGPCSGPLMSIHAHEIYAQLTIADGLYYSLEADSVRALVENDLSPAKYFVGYAGWSPNQLESEMEEGSWLLAAGQPTQLFDTPPDLWRSLLRQITLESVVPNINPKIVPDDPSMN